MPTVCLSMIVKDEAHCIERCLHSLRGLVDYWAIEDTGSTDDTQARIWAALAGVPGELIENAWVDFSTNRNHALERAVASGCDYILSVDADEWAAVEDEGWKGRLTGPAYALMEHYPDTVFPSVRLVRADANWTWHGVVHEHLYADPEVEAEVFAGLALHTDNASSRNADPLEMAKDAALLEAALAEDPTNTRYQFYLGISYFSMQRYADAIAAFRERVRLGGTYRWEVWYSVYAIGMAWLNLQDAAQGMDRLAVAYGIDPNRAEPLYWLGMQYYANHKYAAALPFFELAAMKPLPMGIFVEQPIYDYRAQLMLAVCLACVQRPEDAARIGHALLEYGDLEQEERELLTAALDPALQKG